ncbi:SH3 domain-containing protein [Chitinophaga jiangningensis]|uniref:SH3 domain-containing protein n=1 Tax=Chitinophaga jiangningensis TaxID=1419482 RepID=A0A1M6VQB9_9BACT|nr:DUF4236 domain-containing protein [Chitinophaga jiangningensis]SHK83544.1 SH3 domain-containing protein [Chitinophaga jiangningensis]
MGWSYRKSISAGPFRMNFSKSGISYSVGVKGARVNVGPRGTFVNLSAHGISYRQRLSGPVSRQPAPPTEVLPVQSGINITSAAVENLSDTDSQAFITELNEKSSLVSYTKWTVWLLLVLPLFLLYYSFGKRDKIIRPATESVIVRIFAPKGANIRQEPDVKAKILFTSVYDDKFILLSDTSNKWIKVAVADSAGYVSRELAELVHLTTAEVKVEEWQLIHRYLSYIATLGLLCFVPVVIWSRKKDKQRFQMELHYDMDERYQQVYQQFQAHFASFCQSSRVWQYLNAQGNIDYKRNAGAGKLIKRVEVKELSANKMPIPYFITNVSIPCISLQHMDLYFLPERLLMKRGNTFAAVFYKNLQITGRITNFVESEPLPHDARVVDYTWQFVNKDGGPDRRFNGNQRLPVCAYSEYTFTSGTGIYEVIATSKQAAMDDFSRFIVKIGALQKMIGANLK